MPIHIDYWLATSPVSCGPVCPAPQSEFSTKKKSFTVYLQNGKFCKHLPWCVFVPLFTFRRILFIDKWKVFFLGGRRRGGGERLPDLYKLNDGNWLQYTHALPTPYTQYTRYKCTRQNIILDSILGGLTQTFNAKVRLILCSHQMVYWISNQNGAQKFFWWMKMFVFRTKRSTSHFIPSIEM